MPLLVALDECNRALLRIEVCAQLGLSHPELREAILILILMQCDQTDLHIGELALRSEPYLDGDGG